MVSTQVPQANALHRFITLLLYITDPDDYIGGAFLLLFERASNTACLDIDIVMDDIFEDDEIFLVTVSSDDPAISTGTLVSAPAIILDETGEQLLYTYYVQC